MNIPAETWLGPKNPEVIYPHPRAKLLSEFQQQALLHPPPAEDKRLLAKTCQGAGGLHTLDRFSSLDFRLILLELRSLKKKFLRMSHCGISTCARID